MDENGSLPRQPPVPPPPPPGVPPSGAPQIVYQTTPSNGMAVASLVLGILTVVLSWTVWLAWILGVLAIVFGAIGRGKARQGAPNGGMATAGLILGIVGFVLSILIVVAIFQAFEHGTFDGVGIPIEP